eukprot:4767721-Ditylum_brightwellii.AAC.1
MDAEEDDIIKTTQKIDFEEESNEQIPPPSAAKSSLQKSLVKIGGDYSVTFGVDTNKKSDANTLAVTFSSLGKDKKIEDQYKSIGEQLQKKEQK